MPNAINKVQLFDALTETQQHIFTTVRQTAQRTQLPVYLVGGAVRDWLLGCQHVGDLDFVVEQQQGTDAIGFANELQREHGGDVLAHDKFRTATWHTPNGESYDFATARTETYPRPAALPIVQPSDILTDLARRDFTVNAIAYRLSDDAVLDPFAGIADLHTRTMRILHENSFADDPTRLLRGARYAARLGFIPKKHTQENMRFGLPHLRNVSGERIKYDLELIFQEAQPELALALLQDWGVFKALGIPVPENKRICVRFERIRKAMSQNEWTFETLNMLPHDIVNAMGWGALTYNMGQLSISRWIDFVPFTTDMRDALVSLGALSSISAPCFRTPKHSVCSALLNEFSGLALLLGYLFDPDALKRRSLLCEWKDWRWVRPVTTGDDLRKQGVPPGPIYGQVLQRLRNAWLDEELHSLGEEQALLKQMLKAHSTHE